MQPFVKDLDSLRSFVSVPSSLFQCRPICLSGSRHAPKVPLRSFLGELRHCNPQENSFVFFISASPYLDGAAIPFSLLPQSPPTTRASSGPSALLSEHQELKSSEDRAEQIEGKRNDAEYASPGGRASRNGRVIQRKQLQDERSSSKDGERTLAGKEAVVIGISNFPTSSSVRCDRIMHELAQFLPHQTPSC